LLTEPKIIKNPQNNIYTHIFITIFALANPQTKKKSLLFP